MTRTWLIDGFKRCAAFQAKQEAIEAEIKRMQSIRLANCRSGSGRKGSANLKDGKTLSDSVETSRIELWRISRLCRRNGGSSVKEQVEISIKYEGYIAKAIEKVEKLSKRGLQS